MNVRLKFPLDFKLDFEGLWKSNAFFMADGEMHTSSKDSSSLSTYCITNYYRYLFFFICVNFGNYTVSNTEFMISVSITSSKCEDFRDGEASNRAGSGL